MLELVERSLHSIRAARTEADAAAVLAGISASLGFRSGYLVEYNPDVLTVRHIIDSSPDRSDWWQAYLRSASRGSTEEIRKQLGRGEIFSYDQGQYLEPNDPLLALARRNDMVQVTIVPVNYGGEPVGVAGFSGNPTLTTMQQSALQLLVYTLFAHVRTYQAIGITAATEPLTPREKEVIVHSADGFTSDEIAERLGMSARTVNQHVDNVARKLGTKNRAHTVAEAIRRNMLGPA
jgi:LuxR family quorum sensing-dependent transcriptional regulator